MSLNPCCSGQWSRTINFNNFKSTTANVLILVVVDNGLVQFFDFGTRNLLESLNPCCSGQWSRTCLLVAQWCLTERS